MDTTDTSLLELSRNPLMQAMRRVIQVAAKSHLAPESLSRMSPDLAAIGRIMDLTPGQSLLFTLFVECLTIRKSASGTFANMSNVSISTW